MTKQSRSVPILVSVIAGGASTPLAYAIALALGRGNEAAYSIWLWFMYPALLVMSAFLGYRWPSGAWQYGFIAVVVSYIGALIVVPGAGNLLPFEIIAELLLSLPAAYAGRLGANLRN